ncbi:hypothetical protein DVT68_08620 [Dyella solisilvae]|uniref:PH domain-containing protein n=1 Tax=Dyella solisilvae TaxID=1920168 RepID=A0A370K7H0_9GAMM|nr:hypothetical protein [Dyella solisilvae]RDI98582.1 hypothetical protein DVT68_08620 [Dyella solisilvae]
MQRLSSPSTFFYKRVFPVFWFGMLAVFLLVWVGSGAALKRPEMWPSMGVPVVMAVVGFTLFRRLLFDLVDEVWLDGDALVVKNQGDSTRVALDNIINVNATTLTNPPRITLMLRVESSRLGRQVSFIPAGPRSLFSAFKPSPVALDLIERIDARRRRPA